MDRDAAVARIKRRLGNRTDAIDTRIIDELDAAQDIHEKKARLPWFLLTEDLWVDTVADEERVRVPTNFLREYESGALWLYDSTADTPWTELKKNDKDALRKNMGVTLDASGQPTCYSLSGVYFRLAPVPDAVYRLYVQVYRRDTKPSAFPSGGETNLWLTEAPEVVITTALEYLARHMQFPVETMRRFERDAQEAETDFWRNCEAREHTNRRYVRGI